MVDDLDGDLAGVGSVEGAALGGVQFCPGRFIHLCPERPLQLLVGPVAAREIGVAHEEALAVVVGVDEPAGDVGSGVAANLPGGGIVDVETLDLDLNPAIRAGFDLPGLGVHRLNVRLAEDHEQVAAAGLLQQLLAHRRPSRR